MVCKHWIHIVGVEPVPIYTVKYWQLVSHKSNLVTKGSGHNLYAFSKQQVWNFRVQIYIGYIRSDQVFRWIHNILQEV